MVANATNNGNGEQQGGHRQELVHSHACVLPKPR